jgi:hypothetical protein
MASLYQLQPRLGPSTNSACVPWPTDSEPRVVVTRWLYESGGRNAKFRPVVFHEEDEGFIYRVDISENYEALLWWLHEAARIVPDLSQETTRELFPHTCIRSHIPSSNFRLHTSWVQLLALGFQSKLLVPMLVMLVG